MKAYYFSTLEKKLLYGDNRLIEEGITHTVSGPPVLCQHGLHASLEPLDALRYAPGAYLWLVELGGEIEQGHDKLCATERTYIKGFDATELLWKFARTIVSRDLELIKLFLPKEEYDVIDYWLKTGDEEYKVLVNIYAERGCQSLKKFYRDNLKKEEENKSYMELLVAEFELTAPLLRTIALISEVHYALTAVDIVTNIYFIADIKSISYFNNLLKEMINEEIK